MINAKKLIEMAKWQGIVSIRRKIISFPKTNGNANVDSCNIGHFVIYTADRRCFEVPLAYLYNIIFQVLFKMSEDEFGLPSDGPITLPCNAIFMEYVISLIRRGITKDVENALLNHITTSCCSLSNSVHQGHTGQQLLVCGY